jgi:hypothetical protein
VQPTKALQYSMTLPTSVVITGIDSSQVLDQAIEAARTFKPMTKKSLPIDESSGAQPPRPKSFAAHAGFGFVRSARVCEVRGFYEATISG